MEEKANIPGTNRTWAEYWETYEKNFERNKGDKKLAGSSDVFKDASLKAHQDTCKKFKIEIKGLVPGPVDVMISGAMYGSRHKVDLYHEGFERAVAEVVAHADREKIADALDALDEDVLEVPEHGSVLDDLESDSESAFRQKVSEIIDSKNSGLEKLRALYALQLENTFTVEMADARTNAEQKVAYVGNQITALEALPEADVQRQEIPKLEALKLKFEKAFDAKVDQENTMKANFSALNDWMKSYDPKINVDSSRPLSDIFFELIELKDLCSKLNLEGPKKQVNDLMRAQVENRSSAEILLLMRALKEGPQPLYLKLNILNSLYGAISAEKRTSELNAVYEENIKAVMAEFKSSCVNYSRSLCQMLTQIKPVTLTDEQKKILDDPAASEEQKVDVQAKLIVDFVKQNKVTKVSASDIAILQGNEVEKKKEVFARLPKFLLENEPYQQFSNKATVYFNDLKNFVQAAILSGDQEAARYAIRDWVSIVLECIEEKDYATAHIIYSAFGQAALARIIEKLPTSKERDQLKQLNELFSTSDNFKNIRAKVGDDSRSSPTTPLFFLLIKDITAIYDANDELTANILANNGMLKYVEMAKKHTENQAATIDLPHDERHEKTINNGLYAESLRVYPRDSVIPFLIRLDGTEALAEIKDLTPGPSRSNQATDSAVINERIAAVKVMLPKAVPEKASPELLNTLVELIYGLELKLANREQKKASGAELKEQYVEDMEKMQKNITILKAFAKFHGVEIISLKPMPGNTQSVRTINDLMLETQVKVARYNLAESGDDKVALRAILLSTIPMLAKLLSEEKGSDLTPQNISVVSDLNARLIKDAGVLELAEVRVSEPKKGFLAGLMDLFSRKEEITLAQPLENPVVQPAVVEASNKGKEEEPSREQIPKSVIPAFSDRIFPGDIGPTWDEYWKVFREVFKGDDDNVYEKSEENLAAHKAVLREIPFIDLSKYEGILEEMHEKAGKAEHYVAGFMAAVAEAIKDKKIILSTTYATKEGEKAILEYPDDIEMGPLTTVMPLPETWEEESGEVHEFDETAVASILAKTPIEELAILNSNFFAGFISESTTEKVRAFVAAHPADSAVQEFGQKYEAVFNLLKKVEAQEGEPVKRAEAIGQLLMQENGKGYKDIISFTSALNRISSRYSAELVEVPNPENREEITHENQVKQKLQQDLALPFQWVPKYVLHLPLLEKQGVDVSLAKSLFTQAANLANETSSIQSGQSIVLDPLTPGKGPSEIPTAELQEKTENLQTLLARFDNLSGRDKDKALTGIYALLDDYAKKIQGKEGKSLSETAIRNVEGMLNNASVLLSFAENNDSQYAERKGALEAAFGKAIASIKLGEYKTLAEKCEKVLLQFRGVKKEMLGSNSRSNDLNASAELAPLTDALNAKHPGLNPKRLRDYSLAEIVDAMIESPELAELVFRKDSPGKYRELLAKEPALIEKMIKAKGESGERLRDKIKVFELLDSSHFEKNNNQVWQIYLKVLLNPDQAQALLSDKDNQAVFKALGKDAKYFIDRLIGGITDLQKEQIGESSSVLRAALRKSGILSVLERERDFVSMLEQITEENVDHIVESKNPVEELHEKLKDAFFQDELTWHPSQIGRLLATPSIRREDAEILEGLRIEAAQKKESIKSSSDLNASAELAPLTDALNAKHPGLNPKRLRDYSLAEIVDAMIESPELADLVFRKNSPGKYRELLAKEPALIEKMIKVEGDKGGRLRAKIKDFGLLDSSHFEDKKVWQIYLKVLLNPDQAQALLSDKNNQAIFTASPVDAKSFIYKMINEGSRELHHALRNSGMLKIFNDREPLVEARFNEPLQIKIEENVSIIVADPTLLHEKLKDELFLDELAWHHGQIYPLLQIPSIAETDLNTLQALREQAKKKTQAKVVPVAESKVVSTKQDYLDALNQINNQYMRAILAEKINGKDKALSLFTIGQVERFLNQLNEGLEKDLDYNGYMQLIIDFKISKIFNMSKLEFENVKAGKLPQEKEERDPLSELDELVDELEDLGKIFESSSVPLSNPWSKKDFIAAINEMSDGSVKSALMERVNTDKLLPVVDTEEMKAAMKALFIALGKETTLDGYNDVLNKENKKIPLDFKIGFFKLTTEQFKRLEETVVPGLKKVESLGVIQGYLDKIDRMNCSDAIKDSLKQKLEAKDSLAVVTIEVVGRFLNLLDKELKELEDKGRTLELSSYNTFVIDFSRGNENPQEIIKLFKMSAKEFGNVNAGKLPQEKEEMKEEKDALSELDELLDEAEALGGDSDENKGQEMEEVVVVKQKLTERQIRATQINKEPVTEQERNDPKVEPSTRLIDWVNGYAGVQVVVKATDADQLRHKAIQPYDFVGDRGEFFKRDDGVVYVSPENRKQHYKVSVEEYINKHPTSDISYFVDLLVQLNTIESFKNFSIVKGVSQEIFNGVPVQIGIDSLSRLLDDPRFKGSEAQKQLLKAALEKMKTDFQAVEQMHTDGAAIADIDKALQNIDLSAVQQVREYIAAELGQNTYRDLVNKRVVFGIRAHGDWLGLCKAADDPDFEVNLATIVVMRNRYDALIFNLEQLGVMTPTLKNELIRERQALTNPTGKFEFKSRERVDQILTEFFEHDTLEVLLKDSDDGEECGFDYRQPFYPSLKEEYYKRDFSNPDTGKPTAVGDAVARFLDEHNEKVHRYLAPPVAQNELMLGLTKVIQSAGLTVGESNSVTLTGTVLDGIDPALRGTAGRIEIRYFAKNEENTIQLDHLLGRINYLCDAAKEITADAKIEMIREKFIEFARKNLLRIDAETGEAFSELAGNAKKMFLELQKDLVFVAYPGMSLPKAIKELDKHVQQISIREGRPTVIHVMADGMISANIPKFSEAIPQSFPGTHRSSRVKGVTPNSALEVTGYVDKEGNVDVKAAVSRSTSWSVLGLKGEERQKLSYYQAEAELKNLLSMMDFEDGATVNIHSMMLLTPVYRPSVERFPLVKLFYAGETEQARNQIYSARMLDGKPLTLADGRTVTPSINVTNASVKKPKRFMGLNEDVQESINNIGFAKFIKNQYDSLKEAYPEHKKWLEDNCYRKPTAEIIKLEAQLKTAYAALLDALETPRGKAAKANVAKLEAQLSKAYGELYKDVKAIWKDNPPAIPVQDKQFAYFADALKLYFSGEYVKKKTHAYLFVTAMTRANELAGVLSAKNCKTGKDRTKESIDQDNLALKHEHDTGLPLLSTSPDLHDYVSGNLQKVREHGTGQEVIKYTVPGGLPVSMKDNEWEKKPQRKTSMMSKCHKIRVSLSETFKHWLKSKSAPSVPSAEMEAVRETAVEPMMTSVEVGADARRSSAQMEALREGDDESMASVEMDAGTIHLDLEMLEGPEVSLLQKFNGIHNKVLAKAMVETLLTKGFEIPKEAKVDDAVREINQLIASNTIMPSEFFGKYKAFLGILDRNGIVGINECRDFFIIAIVAQNKPLAVKEFNVTKESIAESDNEALNLLSEEIKLEIAKVEEYIVHVHDAIGHLQDVLSENDDEMVALEAESRRLIALRAEYSAFDAMISERKAELKQDLDARLTSTATLETFSETVIVTRPGVSAKEAKKEKVDEVRAYYPDTNEFKKIEPEHVQDARDAGAHLIEIKKSSISYTEPADGVPLEKAQLEAIVKEMVKEAFDRFQPKNADELNFEGSKALKELAVKFMAEKIEESSSKKLEEKPESDLPRPSSLD